MLTGELKSQVDKVWDSFWSGGISNPLEIIEQLFASINEIRLRAVA